MTPAWIALALAAMPGLAAADERRSGFDEMSASTQAMQRDDLANPGMLWAQDGEALWRAPAGAAGRSCADCHGDASSSMRGAAARHPAFDAAAGVPLTLDQRIAQCRERRQRAPALPPESHDRLSLEAYVAMQSRGRPIAAPADPRLAPFRERGRAHFFRRIGQLDLACAQCHDTNAGRLLGGIRIPQGHPTGYPIYRLEWQTLGSLQRRLRGCMSGVRAEPYAYGAIEFTELELYLAARAAGLPIETPAVRP